MGSRLSRRHFLVASAAVPAVGAVSAAAGSGASTAQGGSVAIRVDEHQLFRRAGTAFGVPPALLAALSHAQTRWQDHDGRPSASMGYGPMHLVDGRAAAEARQRAGKDTDAPTGVDTLAQAAAASGMSAGTLRTDPAANIRASAALLAREQAQAGRPVGVGSDPATWFAAVAAVSGLVTAASQLEMADAVMNTLARGGQLVLADGTELAMPGRRTDVPTTQRAPLARRADRARALRGPRRGPIDAPKGLDVEWIPAPYEQYGEASSDYGNHDLALRPRSPKITHLVIHDTEGEWEGVLDLVQDPTYVSWQYSLRSSDGHIAQHVRARDIAWHAGNWYLNMHSIGLEHEGFAAQGAPWYSEAMYRTSAKLVRYLGDKYHIPLDRAHVIGHDQVPGTTTATIPGMHWDPGPFWDWEHYFDLLKAPLRAGTTRRRPRRGDVVRILPGFVGNVQPVSSCESAGDDCDGKDTNFVTLRVSPSDAAALVNDLGLHQTGQPATTEVSDISARATAGTEFVVADRDGDWTAIWYLGTTAWFRNPRRQPTARVVHGRVPKIRAKPGRDAKVYGRCYPEAEAYQVEADVQAVSPLIYTIPPGQEYVVGDLDPHTDYYKAKSFDPETPGDHVNIVGRDRYVQISLGHRIGFVRRADISVVT